MFQYLLQIREKPLFGPGWFLLCLLINVGHLILENLFPDQTRASDLRDSYQSQRQGYFLLIST